MPFFVVKPLFRALLLLCLMVTCTVCQPPASTQQVQAAAGLPTDTVEVTSFNLEREDSPALAKWAVFEVNKEVICVPPGWTAHLSADKSLALLPPDNSDSTERVTFTRLQKDSPALNYLVFARQLVTKAFPSFQVIAGDTVKHLVFQHDFGVERTVELRANGKRYKGYCLIYVNDRCVYQFRIILATNRLKAYRGDIFRDIIGNLQIDNRYLISPHNPLKQVIYWH